MTFTYCVICEKHNTNHIESKCPEKCTICTSYHTTENHYCMICNVHGADHIETGCPKKCTLCERYHTNENHDCIISFCDSI